MEILRRLRIKHLFNASSIREKVAIFKFVGGGKYQYAGWVGGLIYTIFEFILICECFRCVGVDYITDDFHNNRNCSLMLIGSYTSQC